MIGLYDAEKEDEKVRKTQLKGAKNKGIEKGKKEGIEQGEKNGIQKRNIEITKSMLAKNYNLNDISEITGLTIEEIKKFSKSTN